MNIFQVQRIDGTDQVRFACPVPPRISIEESIRFAEELMAACYMPGDKPITDGELGVAYRYWTSTLINEGALMSPSLKYLISITISSLNELKNRRKAEGK